MYIIMFAFGRWEYNIRDAVRKPTVVILLTDEKKSNELFSILVMDNIATQLYNIIIFIYARITDTEKFKTIFVILALRWNKF